MPAAPPDPGAGGLCLASTGGQSPVVKSRQSSLIDSTINMHFQGSDSSARRNSERSVGRAAFTIIELVGVLTVVAVLAAALIPNVIRRIDRATLQRESSDLSTMANGLVRTIVRDKQIPAQFPPAIAKYLDLNVGQVQVTPR